MQFQVSTYLVTMAGFRHSDNIYYCLHTKQTKQMTNYAGQFSHPLPTVKSAVCVHQHSFLYHILTVQLSIRLLKYQQYSYLLTYLLTPRSRVLLEKLISSQLVKKFTTFFGTRRFITAFTSACLLSLS